MFNVILSYTSKYLNPSKHAVCGPIGLKIKLALTSMVNGHWALYTTVLRKQLPVPQKSIWAFKKCHEYPLELFVILFHKELDKMSKNFASFQRKSNRKQKDE